MCSLNSRLSASMIFEQMGHVRVVSLLSAIEPTSSELRGSLDCLSLPECDVGFETGSSDRRGDRAATAEVGAAGGRLLSASSLGIV